MTSGQVIGDTQFHHVAVTKTGSTVVFYIDGTAFPASAYNPGFSFSGPAYVGGVGNSENFYGTIDELSVYNRALTPSEVQSIYSAGSSGKCATGILPSIYTQPVSHSVLVGANVTFTVGASGTQPLSYQWYFNGTNVIDGATASALTLNNVQFSNAGLYSVIVSNSAGSVPSSNAVLTVNFPPANVAIASVSNAPSGGTVNVPVLLSANGNENALQFSLSFNTSLLTYSNTVLVSGAGPTLFVNESQATNGRVGMALAVAPGSTFPPGTQELVEVVFKVAVVTNPISAAVNFGDQPIVRQLVDGSGNHLAATYTGGGVGILAAAFEGDVSPRSNGDEIVTVADWALIGRFVAGLDTAANGSEFQRADCAPRSMLGDGRLTIIDWVQAGRYAAGLDPLTIAGGPTEPKPGGLQLTSASRSPTPLSTRELQASSATLSEGAGSKLSISLQAQGNENALGFTLLFDPSSLSYSGWSLGSGATGATVNVNTNQIGSGKIGFAMALSANKTFAAGLDDLLQVGFKVSQTAYGSMNVSFGDQPVYREISDTTANSLTGTYLSGTITISPQPLLTISDSGPNVVVGWPAWATNYVLQQSDGLATNWGTVPAISSASNDQTTVVLPKANQPKFYRLQRQ